MNKSILFFALLILMTGCASKRYVKKGMQLENSGLYSDAANQYYNSLLKNINNIDAKIGLQRTGQLVLDDYIDKFKNQYKNGTPKEGVYAFKDAEQYFDKLQKVGMKLIFPEEQQTYYQEVEDAYTNQLYQDASKALDIEEFAKSESIFSEILSLNNNYKDAKSKWVIAKYEPIYRKANEQIHTEMFRSAYLSFKKIIDEVKVYENSLELMNQSLDKAKVTIAIADVTAKYASYQTLAGQLKNKIGNGITSLNNPLYEVVIKNTNKYNNQGKAYEYDRTTRGLVASRQEKEKASFESSVTNYKISNGKLAKKEKRGYLKSTVEYEDETTHEKKNKTVYSKVKYYEYELTRSATFTLEYTMKRTDRDELAISNVFNKEEADHVHFATYEGNYKKLVPGYWKYTSKDSDEDYINDNSSAVNSLRKLIKARKTAKSTAELQNTLIDNCIGSIAEEVANYKPEN